VVCLAETPSEEQLSRSQGRFRSACKSWM